MTKQVDSVEDELAIRTAAETEEGNTMNGQVNSKPVAFAAALTLLLLVGAPALAGGGAIPLWQATTITQPGAYVVTRDISATSGPVFDIQVDGVTIDGCGHTISLSNTTDPVIQIAGPGVGAEKGITIANSRIHGGSYGIEAYPPNPCRLLLIDVTITNTDEAAVRVSNVGNVEATGISIFDSSVGFDLVGPSPPNGRPLASIRSSSIQADVGVRCTGTTCRITDNVITSFGSAVHLSGSDGGDTSYNLFTSASVAFNPQPEPPRYTLFFESSPGAMARDNVLRGVVEPGTFDVHGIVVDGSSHDAKICDNLITGYGGDGIRISSTGTTVRDNQIDANTRYGVYADGLNLLFDGNRIAGNTSDGMHFITPGNVLRGNVLMGNDNPLGGPEGSGQTDGGGNLPPLIPE